jgi:hypothetical protein
MKISNEFIDSRGIRIQTVDWNNTSWSILSNDRFEEGDFKTKITCDICGPTFVPKVINYRGNYLCTACLTRMIEMLQHTTLNDCGKDRHDRKMLQDELEIK